MTDKLLIEQIARIISPETWKCADAWSDLPPSTKAGRERSLAKAKEILKLVGPGAKPARTLGNIPVYVQGVLDTFPMPDGLRSALLSWSDEAAAALRTQNTPDTQTENG